MATVEALNRPTARPSYICAPSRGSLAEVHPNSSSSIEDNYTRMRLQQYPSSAPRPSMVSNLSCTMSTTLANNCRSRSHSKADSISTLWSSAEVPLFLDSSMERSESVGIQHQPRPSTSQLTPMQTSSSGFFQRASDDFEEEEELATTFIMIDGPRSVSSPRSSDAGQYGTPRRESHRQQMRPPPLNLHRESANSSVPSSVSLGSSHTAMPTPAPAPAPAQDKHIHIVNINKQLPSPPPHLYQEAEKFFSLSYTMNTPPPSAGSSRLYDDESLPSPVKALSPSYSYSRDSRSSTDSSSVLPEADSYTNRLAAMTKSVSNDGLPCSPLRVAVGLTTDNVVSQMQPSLVTLPAESPRTKSPAISHAHTAPENDGLRRCRGSEEAKYSFLDSPAPSISGRKPSLSGKKMSLFNSKLKTVSTPKLRADKAETDDSQEVVREHREGSRTYPPQAPSGRFRSRTLGESELTESLQGVNVTATPRRSQDSTHQRAPRRPSSSEALSAMAARMRRPSKTVTIASSHYTSSIKSVSNLNEGYEMGPARIDRAGSTTSSQFFVDSASNNRGTFLKRATSSAAQGKSKSGWASHLSQGLTLHIEQGSKRFAIKMNYLSYDPFGKPESLCEDRPSTPARPKSKSGLTQEKDSACTDSVGLLEFDPRIETEGSISADRLTLDASTDAPVLKHLVIGDDVKGDLITRQANLSLCNIGTHEVSGSERKGKVTWRFVYGVEDCRLDSGEIVAGMKTLRPLSFTCSATLLDPSRAKKSRVINIIRKQIGSHIESMPMPARSASVTSSTYLQPLPTLASPTSSQGSSYQGSPNQRTYSPVASSAPGQSPSRVGLTPFKMTRTMMEAMAIRNRDSGELSSSASLAPTSPRGTGTGSHLTRKSSLLPSPLSCHFPVQPRDHQKRSPAAQSSRLLAPHQIKTRPRGASVGQAAVDGLEPSSALGLDVGDAVTPRRVRCVTTQVEMSRPTTASEEIKQAYLKQSSLQKIDILPSTAAPQHHDTLAEARHPDASQKKQHHNDHSRNQSHQQQHPNYNASQWSRRPSNTIAATTTTTTTITTSSQARNLKQPASPVVSSKQRRHVVSPTAGPPEGPYWL